MTQQYSEASAINDLAKRLDRNHQRLSMPSAWDTRLGGGWVTEAEDGEKESIIVILGAGASYDAAGLPLGPATVRHVKRRVRARAIDDLLEEELQRLNLLYQLNPNELETQLLALTKFRGSRVADVLCQMFDHRFSPSVSFEILAHLLKHRFIDAIINFNFDELLDQALDDELGVGNYLRIVFDGDIARAQRDPEGSPSRLPIYIKPHGTASAGSSLRFTRDAYSLLPSSIRAKLSAILTANPNTTLVTIGFALASIEFNHLLDTARERTTFSAFVIDPNPSVVESFRERDIHAQLLRVTSESSVKQHLIKIWSNVFGRVSPTARGIDRHSLIGHLFSGDVGNQYQHDDEDDDAQYDDEGYQTKFDQDEDEVKARTLTYLIDRTTVELCLAVAKAKGFVNLEQLSLSRAGHYFRLARSYGDTRTLAQICIQLGLHKMDYSHIAFTLRDESERDDANPRSLTIPPGRDWQSARDRLIRNTLQTLQSEETRGRATETPGLFTSVLDEMFKGEEVEVVLPNAEPYQIVFQDPQPLLSLSETMFVTERLLEKESWSQIICVAESGNWLLDNPHVVQLVKDKARRMVLIVADAVKEDDFRATYKDVIEVQEGSNSQPQMELVYRVLPWWLHNEHMTLLLSDEGTPLSGIYFERRLRALAITPVRLKRQVEPDIKVDVDGIDDAQHDGGNEYVTYPLNDCENDVEIALDTAMAYWLMSDRYERAGREDETELWVGQQDVERRKGELALGNTSRVASSVVDTGGEAEDYASAQ
jgi:hypothetical protein